MLPSAPGCRLSRPIPRKLILATPSCSPRLRPGTVAATPCKSLIPLRSSSDDVIAVIASGTFCRDSERFCAVTTMSPTSPRLAPAVARSEEHTSELQSLMRISYAVFCLKKKNNKQTQHKNKQYRTTHINKETTN